MEMFIGFLYGVCATLAGGLAAHFLSKERERHAEFNRAAAVFRSAFVDAQRRLDENKNFDIIGPDGTRVRDILQASIIEHEKAKIIFTAYLPSGKLPSFDKAWDEYYSQENRNAEYLSDYESVWSDHGINLQEESRIRQLALSRIEKMLSFAEIK